MIRNEKRLWIYLRDNLQKRPNWDVSRHEDSIGVGVPDVSYGANGVQGWIELKAIDRWPKRSSTIVRVGLTAIQRRWLVARGSCGERCWVLLYVVDPRAFLLFPWNKLGNLEDGADRRRVKKDALVVWYDRIDWDEFEVVATSVFSG